MVLYVIHTIHTSLFNRIQLFHIKNKSKILYSLQFLLSYPGNYSIIPPHLFSQGLCDLSPPPTLSPQPGWLPPPTNPLFLSFFLRFSVPDKIVIPVSSSS